MEQELKELLGENGLITGDEVKKRPADWLSVNKCNAFAIARPQNVEEVAQILTLCNQKQIGAVVAGGLTGLTHATDCKSDQLQISMERMNKIISIDPIGKTMIVEAGCPLQKVHDAAAEHGLMYAVDLGARGSCTIGGNIATNAGGNTVIRYGMTREQVLGLEVVLADGTIVSSMNTLLKNNTGYDLKQLFIGSEGTLGVVTKAVLRLHSKPISQNTALVAVETFASLLSVFKMAGARFGGLLSSFEVMWRDHFALLTTDSKRHSPNITENGGFYAIIEIQGFDEASDNSLFNAVLEEMMESGHLLDAIICQNSTQRENIWEIREDIMGLYMLLNPLAMFDISMPIVDMDDYVAKLKSAICEKYGDAAQTIVFGHIGDCNLHIVVSPKVWNENTHKEIEDLVYTPLAVLNGSVSAEHGIGLEKRDYLKISRNETEIKIMRNLKSVLDPNGIMNLGKVL